MDLSKHAFFEGKIVLLSEANISIATHGFLYGTAVFGGMRAYWNEEKNCLFVFRPYDHFRRLLHSARMMAMQTQYDEESLIQLTLDLLRTDNWKQDLYLRPTFYKADLGIGVRLHNLKDEFCMFVMAYEPYVKNDTDAHVTVSSWRRIDDNAIPARGKVAGAYANSYQRSKHEAEAAARDGVELAPWDWAFYSEQVRAERYAVDTAALRPWFELDRVLVDGVFHAAELLYGYRFTPRPDLVGYHPDVRVWEVTDADGAAVGLYLGDFFAREGKRGGAWMSSFVRQSRLLGTRPVVVNNLNVNRAADGQPTLLTLDEVERCYLPLSRLLSLYVAATQDLFHVQQDFLGTEDTKMPYIIGVAGSGQVRSDADFIFYNQLVGLAGAIKHQLGVHLSERT